MISSNLIKDICDIPRYDYAHSRFYELANGFRLRFYDIVRQNINVLQNKFDEHIISSAYNIEVFDEDKDLSILFKPKHRIGLLDMNSLDIKIQECAYYMAEKRNFEPGHELNDWLLAKKQIFESALNG